MKVQLYPLSIETDVEANIIELTQDDQTIYIHPSQADLIINLLAVARRDFKKIES